MTPQRYDLIVIGAGSAARDGANKAAKEHGAKVALVEHVRWLLCGRGAIVTPL